MPPSIVIIPTQGLCNRLRAIASAYVLAKYLKTEMYMIWNPEECCNCEFNDLFTNNFPSIDLNIIKDKKYLFDPRIHTERILNDLASLELEDLDYIVIEGGHEFKSPNVSEKDFVLAKSNFYNNLTCVDSIEQYVSNFISNQFNQDSLIIGVHFRNFIKKYDRADGRDFSRDSPIESFINRIKEINETNIKCQFYLSSNSEDAIKMIKQSVPTANFIVETNSSLNRNSKIGIQHALQSLIIMSKTQYIIGTYMSSFSDEASFFQLIPKECVGLRTNNSYHCYGFSIVFNKGFLFHNAKLFLHLQNHTENYTVSNSKNI